MEDDMPRSGHARKCFASIIVFPMVESGVHVVEKKIIGYDIMLDRPCAKACLDHHEACLVVHLQKPILDSIASDDMIRNERKRYHF
jgi:hypothetical protein